ncbi:MAG: hypothetical protein ABL936_25740, partial [Aestuariivirga sp.]
PAEHEARRPNGRPAQPPGQKRQWNPVGTDGGKPSGDNRPRKAGGGSNRNHASGHGTPKHNAGGHGAPKRNEGGKPSWMQEISGAKSDRRPARVGE